MHRAELTFTLYAEAYCTQQNAQSSGETVQGHCEWQGVAVAFLATSSVVDEKRKAQTPAGQSSASRQHRCGASKGESSFRLRRNSGIFACSIAQASPACEPFARHARSASAMMAVSVWSLVTKVRRRHLSGCSLCSDCRGRAYGRAAVPLPSRFQRIRRRLGAVKITPIDKRRARCRGNENNNKQEKSEPFHALDANRSATYCQCADPFYYRARRCVFELRVSLVRGNFSSVRGYGLRTYKPRQGRNAATVV